MNDKYLSEMSKKDKFFNDIYYDKTIHLGSIKTLSSNNIKEEDKLK